MDSFLGTNIMFAGNVKFERHCWGDQIDQEYYIPILLVMIKLCKTFEDVHPMHTLLLKRMFFDMIIRLFYKDRHTFGLLSAI